MAFIWFSSKENSRSNLRVGRHFLELGLGSTGSAKFQIPKAVATQYNTLCNTRSAPCPYASYCFAVVPSALVHNISPWSPAPAKCCFAAAWPRVRSRPGVAASRLGNSFEKYWTYLHIYIYIIIIYIPNITPNTQCISFIFQIFAVFGWTWQTLMPKAHGMPCLRQGQWSHNTERAPWSPASKAARASLPAPQNGSRPASNDELLRKSEG